MRGTISIVTPGGRCFWATRSRPGGGRECDREVTAADGVGGCCSKYMNVRPQRTAHCKPGRGGAALPPTHRCWSSPCAANPRWLRCGWAPRLPQPARAALPCGRRGPARPPAGAAAACTPVNTGKNTTHAWVALKAVGCWAAAQTTASRSRSNLPRALCSRRQEAPAFTCAARHGTEGPTAPMALLATEHLDSMLVAGLPGNGSWLLVDDHDHDAQVSLGVSGCWSSAG